MLDVRNAIANVLDRYTLAQTVEVTLRKPRRDGVAIPFSKPPGSGNRETDLLVLIFCALGADARAEKTDLPVVHFSDVT